MNLKYLLKQFLAFGMLDILNSPITNISNNIAVADNKPIVKEPLFNEVLNSNHMIIHGNSMSVCGINDGDEILISNFDTISSGDFVIVENDKELHNSEYFNHKFKIYKFIMFVDDNYNVDKIINEIKANNYDELIWLKRNQKRINYKYLKARKIYHNCELALCVMYKNGVIDYFFINKNLIRYKVISKIIK